MSSRIDRDVINALIAGHFADPFSVLGMHQTQAGLEVRALLPDATDVWVIEPKTGRKVGKLECLDARGFFCGVLPRRKKFLSLSARRDLARTAEPHRRSLPFWSINTGNGCLAIVGRHPPASL